MNTSMADFMPDSEIANANSRITEYFGKNQDVIMIITETDDSNMILSSDSIKELHSLSQKLGENEDIEGVMSFTTFIEMICQIEYNTSIENSTDEQIQSVLYDILNDPSYEQQKLLPTDDPNEEFEYQRFPRLSKGKTFESADIKNAYIQQQEDTITFTIEVYDLSELNEQLKQPFFPLNVMEWSISFSNQIGPKELQDIDYRIAAHLEPKNEIWTVGEGFFPNFKNIFSQIKNRELFHTFNTSVALWISPPGVNISFPIELPSAQLNFDKQNNQICWVVNRTELGNYGIAPETEGFGLPARLDNFSTSFQYYQLPVLRFPWLRINTEMETIQKFVDTMQHRPFLSKISNGIISKFSSFSWEQFDDMENMLSSNDNTFNDLSLTAIESWWIISDTAPDNGVSKETLFIKPSFMDELKTSLLTFLPKNYEPGKPTQQTLLLAFINGSLPETERKNIVEEFNQEIENIEPSSSFTLKTAGNTQISIELDELSISANKIIMPSIFIAILILLFITFRKLSYMFLPLLGLSLSILWIFGTMLLLDITFNMMFVILVPLMLGLGVDYSVHMFHNYRAELKSGKTAKQAIVASIQEIGTALFLATITTVIAFLSFLTATIKPIRDLGLLSAIGIIFIFIITLTFLSAIRFLLDKNKKQQKTKTAKFSLEKSLQKLSTILIHHTKTIIIITVIISALMGVAALQVETSFDMAGMVPEDNPTVKVFDEIGQTFPSSGMNQEYVLIEGNVATVDTLSGIRSTVDNIDGNDYVSVQPNGDSKIVSVISIVDTAVEQNNSLRSRFHLNNNNIPNMDDDVKGLFSYLFDHDQYKEELQEVLHEENGAYDVTVVRVYTRDETQSSDDASGKGQRLYEQLTEDVTGLDNVKVTVTGAEIMMFVTAQSLTESQLGSTILCIVLAAIVLLIVFRNPMLSLITLIPVLLSISWVLGTMYIIGFDINIMTVMVTSITIGLGVTYAIHAVQRFRLIADETGDIEKAVSSTVSHTGGALIASAATTIAGFGIMMFSPLAPQQQFGFISSITIIYSLLTTMLILPSMLKLWAEWRKKRKGFIITKPKT